MNVNRRRLHRRPRLDSTRLPRYNGRQRKTFGASPSGALITIRRAERTAREARNEGGAGGCDDVFKVGRKYHLRTINETHKTRCKVGGSALNVIRDAHKKGK